MTTAAHEPRAYPILAHTELGTRAPFRSHAEGGPVDVEAILEGSLPSWLAGDLVRTAPALFDRRAGARPYRAAHWFDALGLVYRFGIHEGRVRFDARLLESDVERASRTGAMPTASFGSPIRRSFWRRVIEPIPRVTDNTNVNVLPIGPDLVALTEGPHQWALDRSTLAADHHVTWNDELGDLSMLAHPHFDFVSRRVVNLATEIGPRSSLTLLSYEPSERRRQVSARIPVSRVPYQHAFGLTPRHAIVIGHPFDASPLSLLWSNRGFIDHFRFDASRATKLWLVDRRTGAVRTHEAPPGFVFHVVNAFEVGDETVIDLALYEDASIVSALSRANLELHGLPSLTPPLVRLVMRPGIVDARVEVLEPAGLEFPTIPYRAQQGQEHDVVWGTRIENGASEVVARFRDAHVVTHATDDVVVGEPVFVHRPGGRVSEGVVLVVGSARDSSDRSELRVLDAESLELRARATIEVPIPLGFHGSFVSERRD